MGAVGQAEFLFELLSEEIPAAYQPAVVSYWENKLPALLQEKLISSGEVKIMATPRRLVVYLASLKVTQEVKEELLKGPAKEFCFQDGQPTKALQAFAAKAGIAVEQVTFVADGKGEYATAVVRRGGQASLPLLGQCLAEMISTTPFPRSMRWADYDFSYGRPLLSYLALYGNERVIFSDHPLWEILKPASGVVAHFILQPTEVSFASVAEYQKILSEAGVILDPKLRKEKIRQQLIEEAQQVGGTVVLEESLLEEVTWLVERPSVVRAEFPLKFLQLPECVLLSEMQGHQRYFGIRQADGKLSNQFLIVSNGATEDPTALANIRSGNVRVLQARLADGAFFYHEDRKKPLAERIADLQKIAYLEGLGSMLDKAHRLVRHAHSLQELGIFAQLPPEQVERAALLCKADLTTQLVYEFDHLQGEIGSLYAALDGESAEISKAIFEHYLPRSQHDSYPQSPLGILLSLADKLDNICAGFLLGKQPTSSTDPFGLRRQILYVLELVIHNRLTFSFPHMLTKLLQNFKLTHQLSLSEVAQAIWEFTRARFVTIFEKEGFHKNLIQATVFSGSENIFDLYLRMSALKSFQTAESQQNFHDLLLSFKRMSHILSDYTKKYPQEKIPEVVDESLLLEIAEQNLFQLAHNLQQKAALCHTQEQYNELFASLALAKPQVDHFFDTVMVMHENPALRNNRLALLHMAVKPISSLVDLSRLSA